LAGSFVATFLGKALGLYERTNGTAGWIASVIGAMILLLIYRMIVGRKKG
jgi:uncharacterized membrane protein YeaQ/YmgE (transglycosylase-associated protein family)